MSLWSWAEVVTWLHDNHLAEISPMEEEEVEIAKVCEIADSLIRAHRLQRRLSVKDRERLCHAMT